MGICARAQDSRSRTDFKLGTCTAGSFKILMKTLIFPECPHIGVSYMLQTEVQVLALKSCDIHHMAIITLKILLLTQIILTTV